jgi:hypothetical protein
MPAKDTVLLVHTGLWQWMKPADTLVLSQAFTDWLNAQGYARLLTKSHPHVAAGPLAEMLPSHSEINDTRSLEAMAADIPAATVVGSCCTGLVTLKLMRPDLECIDFGADFYCEKAYRGDHSVEVLMRASGVRIVNMGDTASQN